MKGISNRRARLTLRFLVWVPLLMFLAAVLFLRSPLQSVFWRLAEHLVAANTPLRGLLIHFSSKATLASQNETLTAQLSSTTAALADRDALYQENLPLKNILGRNAAMRFILARVLMRPPATPYDTLLIDIGSKEGIVVGDTVYAAGTTAIGVVSVVYTSTARVTLFSSPGETYSATLRTKDNKELPLTITGQGGGSLRAKVPAGSAVSVGDSIVLATIQGGFVASVSSVSTSQDQSFEMLYLQEPINPFTLGYIEIGKPYGQ